MIATALAVLAAAAIHNQTSPNPKMKWWTEARFGMFVHWDMSSLAGTEISWSRKGSKPLDITGDPAGYVGDPVYDHLYERFNPTNFNANDWAKLAKEAGMKYVVFTAKHHGGFSMFHTNLSHYGIADTPFKRDILKELFQACRKQGLRVGIYYSPRDWHQPDYGATDSAKYHAYLMGQLTELLTNYGKIDIMWFDSFGKGDSISYWKADEMLALVHRLQPDIIVNNRAGYFGENVPSLKGDFDTPEQRVGEFQNNRPWESCMTVVKTPDGGGWSYRKDGQIRSLQECWQALASCAGGDGNLLLDVGPDSTGTIPADQTEVLRKLGELLKQNGQSIYNARGGPYQNGPWGASTYRGNDVYLHLFPAMFMSGNEMILPPIDAKVLSANFLEGGEAHVSQDQSGLHIGHFDMTRPPVAVVVHLHLDRPAATLMQNQTPIPVPPIN